METDLFVVMKRRETIEKYMNGASDSDIVHTVE
jgi:hypothetical protein